MNAYSIHTQFNHSQKTIVVSENMAQAETIFQHVYKGTKILSIELESNHVYTLDDLKEKK